MENYLRVEDGENNRSIGDGEEQENDEESGEQNGT